MGDIAKTAEKKEDPPELANAKFRLKDLEEKRQRIAGLKDEEHKGHELDAARDRNERQIVELKQHIKSLTK